MSKADDFRAAIPRILERCSSIDELFQNVPGSDLDGLSRVVEEEYKKAQAVFLQNWAETLKELSDRDKWTKLSSQPAEFDRELDKILRRFKKVMKFAFRIPANRPPKNQERDKQIVSLRKANPKMSYGQIGIKVGINKSNLVGQAAKRVAERERIDLKQLLELIADSLQADENR